MAYRKLLLSLFVFFTVQCSLFTNQSHAQVGEWTWMKGSSSSGGAPVYGTQGVSNPANTPPALYEAAEWTDHDGNFWMFGGLKDFGSEYNTLWKFNPAINEWTWMKGGNTCCQAGVYGTMGIPSINNTPGARSWGATSWVDTAGHLWLYGGIGDDGIGGYQVLSDLWMYDIATNEWTWVYGPNEGTIAVNYGTIGIPASSNLPGARAESNAAWADSDNNFWMFGGALYFPQTGGWSIGGFGNDMWKFDTDLMLWVWMKGTTVLSGSGIYGTKGVPNISNYPPGRGSYSKWKDANGDLWVFGGYNLGSSWNDVWRYNIATNTWTWMSGSNALNNNGTVGTQCVPDTNNAPSSRYENRMFWTDDNGNFWIYGGIRSDANSSITNDLWQYNPVTDEWTWVSGSQLANQPGNYGTIGVSSPSNVPPSKFGGVAWKDTDGNFWTFGGSPDVFVAKNDLWRYVPDPDCPIFDQSINFGVASTDLCEKFCTEFIDSSTNNPTSWLWLFPGGSPSSSTDQNPTNICYDTPGTFDVTLITTSASGTDTLTLPGLISVYSNPLAPVITQVDNVLTSTPAISYQWYLNTDIIPGEIFQSITITQSGLYTVVIGDENGCTAQSSIDAFLSGIDELNAEYVSIYPNPSTGNIMVEMVNGQSAGETKIRIHNTLGQIVFSSEEKISSPDWKKDIDLHDAAPGIYFIELKTQDNFVKKKVILLNQKPK